MTSKHVNRMKFTKISFFLKTLIQLFLQHVAAINISQYPCSNHLATLIRSSVIHSAVVIWTWMEMVRQWNELPLPPRSPMERKLRQRGNFSWIFDKKKRKLILKFIKKNFRIFENGTETVMKYENDVLKAKTVNGVPQAISYNH